MRSRGSLGRWGCSHHQEARTNQGLGTPGNRCPAASKPRHRLGLCSRLHRRCDAARIRRGAARRKGADLCFVPRKSRCLVCQARSPGAAIACRQRIRLCIASFPRCSCCRRRASQLHAPLQTTDQRQGGALHPDANSRMGIRPILLKLCSQKASARSLARQLQPLPATCWHWLPDPISETGECRVTNVPGLHT